MEKKKYVFMKAKEINGFYEYYHRSIHTVDASDYERINKLMNEYLVDFYGGKSEKCNDGFYFNNGEVYVEVSSCKLISEEHYNILSQYL